MTHHAISDNNDLLESLEYLADLFGAEPSHIATSWHEGRFETDAATTAYSFKHACAVLAEGIERSMEIETRDLTARVITVEIVDESVDNIRRPILRRFGWLESSVGHKGSIVAKLLVGTGVAGETRVAEELHMLASSL